MHPPRVRTVLCGDSLWLWRGRTLVVDIAISYDGNLRCSATHGPSGSNLLTDAPKDNHGNGEAFSPTDLVATALGTCALTTMAIAARHRGIELAGATMKVTKEMVAKPIRRIARLTVELHIPMELPEEQRAALEWSARSCPVHKSMHPDVEMPIAIVWGSRGPVTGAVATPEASPNLELTLASRVEKNPAPTPVPER